MQAVFFLSYITSGLDIEKAWCRGNYFPVGMTLKQCALTLEIQFSGFWVMLFTRHRKTADWIFQVNGNCCQGHYQQGINYLAPGFLGCPDRW